MQTASYEKGVAALLRNLPRRSREVLGRRYGLNGRDAETLEEIGKDFGVTRERVRQIEANALRQVHEEGAEVVLPALRELERHLDMHGGVRAEQHLFDDFTTPHAAPGTIQFLLEFGEAFNRHPETAERHHVWALDTERLTKAEQFTQEIVSRLEAFGKTLEEAAFWEMVESEARSRRLALTERARNSWIGISRFIAQGPLGRWGLRTWPEVVPHDVGDWAFIALRTANEPRHFTEIVRKMNAVRTGMRGSSAQKPANLQTVHNALIKDARFVLVGRGLYALREWGYQPGTVRDVITQILRDAKRPLSRDEIIAQVASARRVQPNTIILNLQNRSSFARTAEGRYALRRA